MPHRHNWRTSLLMIGVACAAVPLGCMKPSNLRPENGPIPELSRVGEPPQSGSTTIAAPVAGQGPSNGTSVVPPNGQPPRATLPPEPSPNTTDPTVFQAGASSTPPQSVPGPATEPQPATTPPQTIEPPKSETPPTSTPLLDAEIRRVENLTQQHFESLPAISPLESPTRPLLDVESTKVPEPTIEATPPLPPTSKPTVPTNPVEPLAEPAQLPINIGPAPAVSTNPPAAETAGSDAAADPRPNPSDAAASENLSLGSISDLVRTEETPQRPTPTSQETPQLGIDDLKLCGKIHRFGEYEPLDTSSLKAGQPVLVYCEIAELKFEPRGDNNVVSRLSSHLELQAERGGPILWEQTMPTAAYVCRRQRRDNFVNYRIKLPTSLEPGSYRLRLILTDLIAARTTSADITLKIVP